MAWLIPDRDQPSVGLVGDNYQPNVTLVLTGTRARNYGDLALDFPGGHGLLHRAMTFFQSAETSQS
jgi:hypothetical protein